jgi:hypothetical protein
MGASGWDYRVRYQPDLETAFLQLQDQVLESGDFLWSEEYYGPRPTTRWQLSAIKDRDEFWEEGTHSILDMDRIVPADAGDEEGAIRPLSEAEEQEHFGGARPTEAEFDRVYQEFGPLIEDIPRWSGRCAILYEDSQARQIAFFGVSGD